LPRGASTRPDVDGEISAQAASLASSRRAILKPVSKKKASANPARKTQRGRSV
jgi:hypothetical protein